MFTSTTLSQWNFYSATVNASGVMTLYKNGELIAQKIDGVTPNTILRNKQFIGKSNFAADGYFKGAIDELRIYNITGDLVSTESVKDLNAEIDASNLSNGVYIIQLEKDSETEVLRWIKQN